MRTRTRTRPEPIPAYAHTKVAQAAAKRADDLEDRLTSVLEPILRRAGDEAARRFRETATDHLTASLHREADFAAVVRSGVPANTFAMLVLSLMPLETPLALRAAGGDDSVTSTSTMVCVKPRPEEAQAIADPDGVPPDVLHVTLAYLGEIEDADALAPVVEALKQVAANHAPLSGVVGGYGEFRPPGVGILLPDVPGLVELRVALTEALVDGGIDYARNHGFLPHVSVDGSPEDGEIDEMLERAAGEPLHFDALLLVRGDETVATIPLVGVSPLTAAGDPQAAKDAHDRLSGAQSRLRSALESGDPKRIDAAKEELRGAKQALNEVVVGSRWTPPAASELIDSDALAKTLHSKTDPVRQRLIETTMTPTLKQAGLSFDVTNPLTAKALASTAQHIVSISDTTRANVMRIIGSAQEAGLSIDDTAKAIQAGMREAAPVRARMIARTELVGAVNGGSLAATQLVASATGSRYLKQWLTAPGAPNPRHELYDGLDGQTVELDAAFDVGGSSLAHPGDQDGDPGEVINCRCTMIYVDAPAASAAAVRDSIDAPTMWGEGDL